MTNQTLSRPAALVYIQKQRGCTPETAKAILSTKPVAARWNDGFGPVAYYYTRDLDARTQADTGELQSGLATPDESL